jgi:hypothetical protein
VIDDPAKELQPYIDKAPDAIQTILRKDNELKKYVFDISKPSMPLMQKVKYSLAMLLNGGKAPQYHSLEQVLGTYRVSLENTARVLKNLQQQMLATEQAMDPFYERLLNRERDCSIDKDRALKEYNDCRSALAELALLGREQLSHEQKRNIELARRIRSRQRYTAGTDIIIDTIMQKAAENTRVHLDGLLAVTYVIDSYCRIVHAKAEALTEEIREVMPLVDKMYDAFRQGVYTQQQMMQLQNLYMNINARSMAVIGQGINLLQRAEAVDPSMDSKSRIVQGLGDSAERTIDMVMNKQEGYTGKRFIEGR